MLTREQAHRSGVIAMLLQIRPECSVLGVDCVLLDIRQAEQGDGTTEDGQGRSDPERVLASAKVVWCIVLDDWEHICANKSTDLAERCCNSIVATSHWRCGCL